MASFQLFNFRKKDKRKKGLEAAQSAGEELAAISNENSNSFLQWWNKGMI